MGLLATVLVAMGSVAQAQTSSGHYLGEAFAECTDVAGTRWFAARTEQTTVGSPADRSGWEMNVDGANVWSVTFYQRTTGVTGDNCAAPNADLFVRASFVDDSGAGVGGVVVVCDSFNAAFPDCVDGATYQFDSNGVVAAGVETVGLMELSVGARKTGGLAGYNLMGSTVCDSTIGGAELCVDGVLRANSGSLAQGIGLGLVDVDGTPTYAIGAAGTETITTEAVGVTDTGEDIRFVPSTGSFVWTDRVWDGFNLGAVLDTGGQAVGAAGQWSVTRDVDASYVSLQPGMIRTGVESATHSYFGISMYTTELVVGPDQHGQLANAQVTIDTTLTYDQDGLGQPDDIVAATFDLYNRGESVALSWALQNARGENLSRPVSFDVENSLGAVEENLGAQTSTGGIYSDSYTVGAGDSASLTFQGSPKVVVAVVDGVAAESGASWNVTRLYRVDVHTQLTDVLVQDPILNSDQAEDFTFIISADIVYSWCHVTNARADTPIDTVGGSSVTMTIDAPNGNPEYTDTTQTQADGWTASGNNDFSSAAPAGFWDAECTVSSGGNEGSDVDTLSFVSAFTADLEVRLVVPDEPTVGQEVTIWVYTGKSGGPRVPNDVPRLRIGHVNTTSYLWEEIVAAQELINAQDWTNTVQGTVYAYNWTVVAGSWEIYVQAIIDAAPIWNTDNLLGVMGTGANGGGGDQGVRVVGSVVYQHSGDPWTVGRAFRWCPMEPGTQYNLTGPGGTTSVVVADGEGCGAATPTQAGLYTLQWSGGSAGFTIEDRPVAFAWTQWVATALFLGAVVWFLKRGDLMGATMGSMATVAFWVPAAEPLRIAVFLLFLAMAWWRLRPALQDRAVMG